MGGREVRGDGREGAVDKRGRGHRGGSVVPYSEADAFSTHTFGTMTTIINCSLV